MMTLVLEIRQMHLIMVRVDPNLALLEASIWEDLSVLEDSQMVHSDQPHQTTTQEAERELKRAKTTYSTRGTCTRTNCSHKNQVQAFQSTLNGKAGGKTVKDEVTKLKETMMMTT